MTDDRPLEHNPLVDVADLEALHEAAFGWALTLCGYRREEAEDIMQAAYTAIVSGKAVYRGESGTRAWLFGVIRNFARRRARSLMLRTRLMEMLRGGPNTGVDEQDPDADRQTRRVLEALGTLPTRQRHVAELVFYRDLSVAEAAGVLGISVGSARVHYDRAKKSLAVRLADLSRT